MPSTGQVVRYDSRCLALVLLAWSSAILHAQTIDDGDMVPAKTLCTGVLYTHDRWDHYWEGPLQRVNGNLGTITTQTATFSGNYGVTNRLDLIATVPYVWTNASQGVLSGLHGFQDINVAAKFNFLTTTAPFRHLGALRLFAVGFGGAPLTAYSPDFQPLSLGVGSRRIGGRFTLNFQSNAGWFVNASPAYTSRGVVSLDRPYYFTQNQLFLTNQVNMPDVFDYVLNGGYRKKGLLAQFNFGKQITEGGGDIRRQDAPFVSNRMIFSKVGATVMYPLPMLKSLSLRFEFSHVIDGRNVGQSTTISTGFMKTISFRRRS